MLKIRQQNDGILAVSLGLGEAAVLRDLPDRLRLLLENPGFDRRVTEKLFPKAYTNQRDETEYRRLLGKELVDRKLRAVDAFESTLSNARIRKTSVDILVRPEEFDLWLGYVFQEVPNQGYFGELFPPCFKMLRNKGGIIHKMTPKSAMKLGDTSVTLG